MAKRKKVQFIRGSEHVQSKIIFDEKRWDKFLERSESKGLLDCIVTYPRCNIDETRASRLEKDGFPEGYAVKAELPERRIKFELAPEKHI